MCALLTLGRHQPNKTTNTMLYLYLGQFHHVIDTAMQFGCDCNTGDTVTPVYMYNFQNIVLCFRNNIELWKIAVFIQNNFLVIKAYKQKF